MHEHLFHHTRSCPAFQAATTQLYGEVTLASCLIDGKPGVAIVLVDNIGEGKIAVIIPLFVAITADMDIAFAGECGGNGGEGGGPRRGLNAAKGITAPFMWHLIKRERSRPGWPARSSQQFEVVISNVVLRQALSLRRPPQALRQAGPESSAS